MISINKSYIGVDTIYQDFLINCIQAFYTKIDLIADYIQVNIISNQLAIVIFQYHTECIKRDTSEKYGIAGLETQVIIKENNIWKLLHVHYSK